MSHLSWEHLGISEKKLKNLSGEKYHLDSHAEPAAATTSHRWREHFHAILCPRCPFGANLLFICCYVNNLRVDTECAGLALVCSLLVFYITFTYFTWNSRSNHFCRSNSGGEDGGVT